jgi:GGDEF domain-containing protein
MAGLEQRNGNYNIIIRFGGARFVRSLKTKDSDEAEDFKTRVEQNVRRVDQGLVAIPDGADIPTFLLTDFRVADKPVAHENVMLGPLMDAFFESIPERSLEETTVSGMQVHHPSFVRETVAKHNNPYKIWRVGVTYSQSLYHVE